MRSIFSIAVMHMMTIKAMSSPLNTESATQLSIRPGHTLLLDEHCLQQINQLTISSGLVRVGLSSGDQEAFRAMPITLGFLQTGDHLQLDLLRHSRLHIRALTAAQLESNPNPIPLPGASSIHDWTVALLTIRHLGDAEQRITALLQLLVERLGRRLGDWYEIPLRLTHAELADLCGHTRVTVTRQLSRWQKEGLIQKLSSSDNYLRLAPDLVEARED